MSTAIIIGVGQGLGTGLVKTFCRDGYHVAMVARNKERLEGLRESLVSEGHQASSHAADAGDFGEMRSTIQSITEEYGPVKVLIYNAVIGHYVTPMELDPEKVVANYRVDVAGALNAVQAIVPHMETHGEGTIVLSGGGSALYPWTGGATITMAKAAGRNLAFMLAEELQNRPVRVGTVTIMGAIQEGTPFSPERIGKAYVEFVKEKDAGVELQFTGA